MINNEHENINAYGEENLSYIKGEDLDNIIDSVKSYEDAEKTPGKLIKLIHFDVNHPENRNLIMDDDGKTCIYHGKGWKIINKETFHDLVVDRAFNIVNNYYTRRRELYKLKNNLLGIQSELAEKYKDYNKEIEEKYKIIIDTNIVVNPVLCPNHPKKPCKDDLQYEFTIFDLYGNNNLKNYFKNKIRIGEIKAKLEENLCKDEKDNLNLELIELNDKIIDFEQKEVTI